MDHNNSKLALLNDNSFRYFHTIGSRDYIHSTTIVALCHEMLGCSDIMVSLRKVVKSGFKFSDMPDEDDLGFVVIDNTPFFLKATDDLLERCDERDLNSMEQKLFFLNTLVQTSLDVNSESKQRYLSRKLSVYLPAVSQNITQNIETRVTILGASSMVDVSYNNVLVYRQHVQVNKFI